MKPKSDNTPATPDRRWITALHESAHVVVAQRLNRWNTRCRAVVLPSGGGFASLPLGTTRHSWIVAVAAGKLGEKLSKRFRPPRTAPRPAPPMPTELQPEIAAIRANALAEIRQEEFRSLAKNDEQILAEHCIEFEPGNPRDWQLRFREIHREARELVQKHRLAIRDLARKLYIDGEITIEGDTADNAFFSSGK
jgi:hypothetical protein